MYEDHDEEHGTLEWDVYENGDDISQYNGVHKIIFDEYQDYKEEIPILNDEQIDLWDGVDVADETLEVPI